MLHIDVHFVFEDGEKPEGHTDDHEIIDLRYVDFTLHVVSEPHMYESMCRFCYILVLCIRVLLHTGTFTHRFFCIRVLLHTGSFAYGLRM